MMAAPKSTRVDCLIVGGGPAGQTAATYLGRFRRSVLVIDAGESRLSLVPRSMNIPGFPDGVHGPDLLALLKDQALRYGAKMVSGTVTAIERQKEVFEAQSSVGPLQARRVVLATGISVMDPDIADLGRAIGSGVVRYCPVCDGFEAVGARVAVLGGRPGSIDEAHFLRTYVDDLTYVPSEKADRLSPEVQARASAAGIKIEWRPCTSLVLKGAGLAMGFASGPEQRFDIVYPCLGTEPRSDLARRLGAPISLDGELVTDKHHETGADGLYAVGDVLRGLDQVASACGQAAIAATAIHNALRRLDDEAAGLPLASSSRAAKLKADHALR